MLPIGMPQLHVKLIFFLKLTFPGALVPAQRCGSVIAGPLALKGSISVQPPSLIISSTMEMGQKLFR